MKFAYIKILVVVVGFNNGICLDVDFWFEKLGPFLDLGPQEPFYSLQRSYGNLTTDLPDNFPPGTKRHVASAQYVLFAKNQTSHTFYSILPTHTYVFIRGRPIDFYVIDNVSGNLTHTVMGFRKDALALAIPQDHLVAFRMRYPRPKSYSILIAHSYPTFVPSDEIHPTREELLNRFPQHGNLIRKFTSVPQI